MALADQHEPQGLAVIARSSHKRRGFTVLVALHLALVLRLRGTFDSTRQGSPAVPGPRNVRGCRAEPVIHDLADAGRQMQPLRVL